MPITLTIDRERRVVYSALHGVIREAEFLQHVFNIKSHSQFDPSFNHIFDVRGVTDVQVSLEVLKEIATRPSIFNRASKHVVIVTALKGPMHRWAQQVKELATETRPNMLIVTSPKAAFDALK